MTQSIPAISDVIRRHMDGGDVSGAVVKVLRDGQVAHEEAVGVLDGQTTPLATDSVFWLASMTKPIVAACALLLHEDGKLDLDDKVSRYIPEFSKPRQVRIFTGADGAPQGELPAVHAFGPVPDPEHHLVPAEREITLRHCLTHTSGLQTIMVPNSTFDMPVPGDSLATYIPSLAKTHLDFQPGSRWAYSNAAAFDVASRVIEVASGQSLAEFMQARIFGRLGMGDTGFGLAHHARAMPVAPMFADFPVVVGKTYFSGAAGLWSSADDYLQFAEMLRKDGDGLLKPESVALMKSNLVGDLFPGLNGRERCKGMGFGLGVASVLDAKAAHVSPPNGAFGWDGIGTRRFWVAPSAATSLFMYAATPALQRDIEAAVFGPAA